MPIHGAAQQGYSNGSSTYERGRPEYSADLLGWLEHKLGVAPGVQVMDLGAGTGKFTKLLARLGAEVTAVEPVDAMRERLVQAVPGLCALPGAAEDIPLDDASVDVVTCAQAFHWFANEAALREIHRVLRAGGRLGLIWNVRDESVGWVAAITEIITPYEGDTPRHYTGRWRQPFEAQNLLTKPQCTVFAHSHVGSFDQVVIDRFMSALADDKKREVEARLRALQDRFPALQQATIAFPYRTEAWCSERVDG
jgi:SAM-dependent methyltransferase